MQTSIEIDELPPLNKFSGAKIFVIDDELLVVDTLTHFLRSAGFEQVHGFSDSAEAVSRMKSTKPDLIFTDIRMPGLSGNKVARIVRGFPHLRNVPIIAITADTSFETSKSIINDGAESVLVKPVVREILIQRAVQTIDNAIEKERSFCLPEQQSEHSERPGRNGAKKLSFGKRRRQRNRFR